MKAFVSVILSSNDTFESKAFKEFSNNWRGEVAALRVCDESIATVKIETWYLEKCPLGKLML